MLTELLEKFEDIFQPITDEEAAERAPEYTATVTEISDDGKMDLGVPKQFKMKMRKIPSSLDYTVAYEAFIDFLGRRWSISGEEYRASNSHVITITSGGDDYIVEADIRGKRYRVAIKVK